MALKFLNKKGWHTGSLRNIENVWKAEQKHEAEQKKLEELRKQIIEERERAEFREIQEQAGLVPRQERLEFLYDSGLAVGKSSGFKALESTPSQTDPPDSTASSSASKAQSSVPGALFEDKPQSANDAWRKLHSDPLLLIRQREQEALARVKNNPVQMAMIRKSVEAMKHKDKTGVEKEEKHRRKHRHHKKSEHHKKSKDYSSDEDQSHEKGDNRGKGRDLPYEDRKHKETQARVRDSKPDKEREERGGRWRRPVRLSEEERAARLREMQLDAEVHEEQRWKRIKKADENDAKEEAIVGAQLLSGGRTFLDAAQRSVYGAEKGGSSTIEESVRRRTHYSQGRSAEATERNAFRR
ncbi:unnamed protein product [Cuscuta europaea]|uniref:CBF1-interacting co-repressor CIR N-terminal domain-containing protein n=1 Tax=Cuscuta europaea TaxID=41803 RepID=A0A9P0Z3U3_CUSEU|nr:unnamed protein product [Cuscuta europaea]